MHSQPAILLGERTLSVAETLRRLHRCGHLVPLMQEVALVEVIHAAAEHLQIRPSDSELQAAADRFRRRFGLTTSLQTREWLRKQNWTLLDFEAAVESELLRDLVARRLTTEQVAPFFQECSDEFQRVQLQEILTDSEGLALELRQQLREEGADFAELARTHSQSASADVGGDLGWVCRSQLPADVASVVFATPAGEVAPPCPSEEGYVLYRVIDFRPAELDHATTLLIQRRLFDDWLRERMSEVRIDLTWIESLNGSG